MMSTDASKGQYQSGLAESRVQGPFTTDGTFQGMSKEPTHMRDRPGGKGDDAI